MFRKEYNNKILIVVLICRRLLEKYEQYVRQQEVQARKRGGLGEMEDVLTPDEKEKAESVKRKIDKWVLG